MNNKPLLPLSKQSFLILLSLASGQKHGYAILKDVQELSAGAMILSTSTLYGALGRLQEQGLIERVAVDEPDDPAPGLPRKFYELSGSGRSLLEVETQRMQTLVVLAQQRLGEGVDENQELQR